MFNPSTTLADLQELNKGTLGEHFEILFTEIGTNYICAKMPVTEKTKQPIGILHGGASVAFAETLGSVAANLCIDKSKKYGVGLEINANHIRSVKEGYVYGKVTPLHVGQSTQVWEIKITTEDEKLVCISRLTVAILDRK